MVYKQHYLALAALFSLLISPYATADAEYGPGMYVGLNAIAGSASDDDITNSSTFDSDGIAGGGITLGYTFSPYCALELAVDYIADVDLTDNSVTAASSRYIGYLAAKPMMPLGKKTTLFARLGVGYVTVDSNENINNNDEENWDAYAGIGASYHPSPALEFALAYNYIPDDVSNVSYASLEFNYHFTSKSGKAWRFVD